MGNLRLREDARELLRAAYERQAMTWGNGGTQIDLQAGYGGHGRDPDGPRLAELVDYMEVMGWVEADPFARNAVEASARRITARGLQVIREGSGLGDSPQSAAGGPTGHR